MEKLTKKNMLKYPLNGEQMQKLNKDTVIIPYTFLNEIFDIKDLFKNTKKVIILYLLDSMVSGHWVTLFLNKDGFNFFDSYGEKTDYQLDRLSFRQRAELDEKQNRLKILLRKYKVLYNNVQLQGKNTDTCGMFVTHRLHNSDLNMNQYIDIFIKNNVEDPDIFVADYILNLFKKYNIE